MGGGDRPPHSPVVSSTTAPCTSSKSQTSETQARTAKQQTRTGRRPTGVRREPSQKFEKQRSESLQKSSRKKTKLPITFSDPVAEAEYMFRIGLGHLVNLDNLGNDD